MWARLPSFVNVAVRTTIWNSKDRIKKTSRQDIIHGGPIDKVLLKKDLNGTEENLWRIWIHYSLVYEIGMANFLFRRYCILPKKHWPMIWLTSFPGLSTSGTGSVMTLSSLGGIDMPSGSTSSPTATGITLNLKQHSYPAVIPSHFMKSYSFCTLCWVLSMANIGNIGHCHTILVSL